MQAPMGLLQLTSIRRASLYMNTDKRNSTLSVGITVANYIPSEFVFRLYLYVAELTLLTKNRSVIEIESNLVIALQSENGAEGNCLRCLCDLFCSLINSICCFSLKLGQTVRPSHVFTSLPDLNPLGGRAQEHTHTTATSGTKMHFTAMPI